MERKNSQERENGSRDNFSTLEKVKDEGEDENEQDEDASVSLHVDLSEEKSSLISESEHFPTRQPLTKFPRISNPFGMG